MLYLTCCALLRVYFALDRHHLAESCVNRAGMPTKLVPKDGLLAAAGVLSFNELAHLGYGVDEQ